MIRARAVGWKAWAALEATDGAARVLAPLTASIYLEADDELVWLGPVGADLHPRAVLTDAPLPGADGALVLDREAAWRWAPEPAAPAPAATLRAGCRALLDALPALGPADGLGALLCGAAPAFPLEGAAPQARSLARACAADDPGGAVEAATALLGLGPGLTPSGDDYVGGAFFSRALVADSDARARWARAAAVVRARARSRTHPISAALLGDLLDGGGPAPLHDLALALARGAPPAAALTAARRLVRLGHSSGWDMLAGFVGGSSGIRDDSPVASPSPRARTTTRS
ncbi:MAG TPA: hypothetical protein DDZ42_00995 [Candidatus Rokubacteria bacterium]|nr:MAG: hypothetical protein A2050_03735 [Candidatus Rokubacteria bacterium GWA2_73_35]HBH00486.1 hypothetical protein [Candidatus Rokubacteria bacterium]